MKLVRSFIVQSILLGSCAFAAWALLVSPGTWPFSLSLDTLSASAVGICLTAMFLFVVALPPQLALRSNRSLFVRTLVGAVSGPVGVWLGLLVLSNYPISWEWYISRAWALHVVFAGVGMCFAVLWHRRLRPNNSFKPTPLRGAA
jgi:hypothetical protein